MKWLQIILLILELLLDLIRCFTIAIKLLIRRFFLSKQKSFQNDVVLITGAGQGLGRELARNFACEGCKVICVDVNASTNNATVINLVHEGYPVIGYAYDLSDRSQVMEMAERILDDVGRVDVLINNASISYCSGAPGTGRDQQIEALFKINTLSHFWMIQAFLPGMLRRDHGHIVAISSVSAMLGLGSNVTFASSKAAITGLMMSLNEELRLAGRRNIKTTIVYPYYISTSLLSDTIKTRWSLLSVRKMAIEVIRGMKQERGWFVIPRYMGPLITIIRLLPKEMGDVFRNTLGSRSKLPPYELCTEECYRKT